MQIQISSGRGPAECEMAVAKFVEVLQKEFDGIAVKSTCLGAYKGCFKSVVIESERDLSFLEGSVKWICPISENPFRPNHKRKNWFIDVSVIGRHERLGFDDELVRFDTFHSGGKGGQHVNKVETGVRATYVPLRVSATSTDGRSQHMNKKLALERLRKMISQQDTNNSLALDHINWLEHTRIERGNEGRVYEGISFKRVK